MLALSLLIPFYNEEQILPSTLIAAWDFLSQSGHDFELILCDDGSTDASRRIAEEFVQSHPENCRLVRNEQNQGRGRVLRKGFAEASAPVAAYIDADLEIGLHHLPTLLDLLNRKAFDVVTGSKLGTPQPLIRARHRKLASLVYNALVRFLLRSPISDHQCGLKGFRLETLRQLLPETVENGWAWDTEILLLAQKKGFRVGEFPVELHSRRPSTVPFFRTVFMYCRKLIEFRRRGMGL